MFQFLAASLECWNFSELVLKFVQRKCLLLQWDSEVQNRREIKWAKNLAIRFDDLNFPPSLEPRSCSQLSCVNDVNKQLQTVDHADNPPSLTTRDTHTHLLMFINIYQLGHVSYVQQVSLNQEPMLCVDVKFLHFCVTFFFQVFSMAQMQF